MPSSKRSVTRPKISNPEELHKRFKQSSRESTDLSRKYRAARATLSPEKLKEIQNSPIAGQWQGLRKKLRETAGLRMAIKSTLINDSKFDILNDRVFTERVYAFLKHPEKIKRDFSMAIIDLDFFKKVNDQYGHMAGDYVLSTLSNMLTEAAKKTGGIAGRFGGEELRVFIPDNAGVLEKVLIEVQEKFRQKIAQETASNNVKLRKENVLPLHGNWQDFNPSFTAGIADKKSSTLREKGIQRVYERLAEDSDLSLYIQKNRERGKIRIFDPADKR